MQGWGISVTGESADLMSNLLQTAIINRMFVSFLFIPNLIRLFAGQGVVFARQ
jgi:hypothetical protein